MTPKFCPGCGRDVEKQPQLVKCWPWELAVDYTLFLGEPAPVTPQQSYFLYTLALLPSGYWVAGEAMGQRIACNPDHVQTPRVLASQAAFHIRKRLGESAPFESHGRLGYRWKDAA